MAGLSGVHPELRRRFLAFAALYRRRYPYAKLIITSGKRSRATQARLYRQAQATGGIAARPGTSLHERGLALDVVADFKGSRGPISGPGLDLLKSVGLRQLPRELARRDPWHIYPVEFGERG